MAKILLIDDEENARVLTAQFQSIYQSNQKNLLDPAVASATVMQGTAQ